MRPQDDNKPSQSIDAKEGSTVKNVIQAVIHLPARAWVVGTVILSFSLLIFAAIFNVGSIMEFLPTPTPTRTPMAFATATDDESLIVVADFQDRRDLSRGDAFAITPEEYVFAQLKAQIDQDHLDIRIERLYQEVDENTAKTVGEIYNATMVVSGLYNDITITPRITRIKTLDGRISVHEGLINFSLSSPDELEFSILTNNPAYTNYLVMFILGMDRYVNEDYSDAEIYLTNALDNIRNITLKLDNIQKPTLNPREVYQFRGHVYFLTKEWEKAIDDYKEVIKLQPEVRIYKNLSICYQNLGDFQNAINSLNTAIKLDENDAESYFMRALSNILRFAPEVVKQDDPTLFDMAIKDFDQVVKLDQEYVADTLLMRGQIYAEREEYDSAIADFSEAIKRDSEYLDAYYGRGSAYAAKGEYDSAISDYKEVIKRNPEYLDAYYGRGLAHDAKGEYDSAISDYKEVIKRNPEYAEAYFSRGSAYAAKGEYDSAIADYREAIKRNSEYTNAYFLRGLVYYYKGDYDSAIADYREAIKLNPGYVDAYYNRGLAYKALGQPKDAIDDFEHILEISMDSEWRKRAEEELKILKGQ